MSNFTYLVENENLLNEYPWFQVLYERGRELESEYLRGRYNAVYRTARTVLEYATNQYLELSGIKVKTVKKNKKGKVNSANAIELNLQKKIDLAKPAGELLIGAHFVRNMGNIAVHNLDYEDENHINRCIDYLFDYVQWVYNQVTGQQLSGNFDFSKMGIDYSETELTKAVITTAKVATTKEKETRKVKRNKHQKDYSLSLVDGVMQITDKGGNLVFSYTPTLHGNDNSIFTKQNLTRLLVALKEKTTQIKEISASIEKEIVSCQQENRYALRKITDYARLYQIDMRQQETISERVDQIQQEENNALTIYLNNVKNQVKDQETCLVEIAKAIKEESVDEIVLYNRINEFTTHTNELYDELKNANVSEKYNWIGRQIDSISKQFIDKDESFGDSKETFSKEQMEQLWNRFQYQFNQASFRYESDRVLWENKEKEFEKDIVSLKQQIQDEKTKCNQQTEKNKRLLVNLKKLEKGRDCLKIFEVILLVSVLCLLVLVIVQKNKIDIYQDGYEKMFSQITTDDSGTQTSSEEAEINTTVVTQESTGEEREKTEESPLTTETAAEEPTPLSDEQDVTENPNYYEIQTVGSNMIEAFFIRRNEEELITYLTEEFYLSQQEIIQTNRYNQLDNFQYGIVIDEINEESASGRVWMSADNVGESVSRILFVLVDGEWKVSYFGQ